MPVPAQAVARVEEALSNAASGRHQFLSGLLHNLAKILAPDHVPRDPFAALEAAGLGPGAPTGCSMPELAGASSLAYKPQVFLTYPRHRLMLAVGLPPVGLALEAGDAAHQQHAAWDT